MGIRLNLLEWRRLLQGDIPRGISLADEREPAVADPVVVKFVSRVAGAYHSVANVKDVLLRSHFKQFVLSFIIGINLAVWDFRREAAL